MHTLYVYCYFQKREWKKKKKKTEQAVKMLFWFPKSLWTRIA